MVPVPVPVPVQELPVPGTLGEVLVLWNLLQGWKKRQRLGKTGSARTSTAQALLSLPDALTYCSRPQPQSQIRNAVFFSFGTPFLPLSLSPRPHVLF